MRRGMPFSSPEKLGFGSGRGLEIGLMIPWVNKQSEILFDYSVLSVKRESFVRLCNDSRRFALN